MNLVQVYFFPPFYAQKYMFILKFFNILRKQNSEMKHQNAELAENRCSVWNEIDDHGGPISEGGSGFMMTQIWYV